MVEQEALTLSAKGSIPLRGITDMNNSYTLTGKLVYDPPRPDFKKVERLRTLIVDLPQDDLAAFYRWFVLINCWEPLQAPMYGTHVTIVSGREQVPDLTAWRKHEGKVITFAVVPILYKRGPFWGVYAKSKLFNKLRLELGLEAKPWSAFHITIGREYDDERKAA